MSDNKFKTAAAKLLDQHKAKTEEKATQRTVNLAEVVKKPPAPPKKAANTQVDLSLRSSDLPPEDYFDPGRSTWAKGRVVILLFALGGCALLTLSDQPTLMRTLAYAAAGLFGGAALGFLIAKKLY
jgi:hypothetical protein